MYGPAQNVSITAFLPLLITAIPFPLLAAALFLLSQVTGRRGSVDVLDAAMIALSAFLLLWAFVFDELFKFTAHNAPVVVVLPLGALLAFAVGLKVVLVVACGIPRRHCWWLS